MRQIFEPVTRDYLRRIRGRVTVERKPLFFERYLNNC